MDSNKVHLHLQTVEITQTAGDQCLEEREEGGKGIADSKTCPSIHLKVVCQDNHAESKYVQMRGHASFVEFFKNESQLYSSTYLNLIM